MLVHIAHCRLEEVFVLARSVVLQVTSPTPIGVAEVFLEGGRRAFLKTQFTKTSAHKQKTATRNFGQHDQR